MSSNPEKCGCAVGWEERPGGAAARRWEREGQSEEVLLGDRGCLWPPAGVSPGPGIARAWQH